jgi:hypothetical protein
MKQNKSLDTPEISSPYSAQNDASLEPSRREFLAGLGGTAVLTALSTSGALAQTPESAVNVARVAVPTSLTLSSENKIFALNDGLPRRVPWIVPTLTLLYGRSPRTAGAEAGFNTIGVSRSV